MGALLLLPGFVAAAEGPVSSLFSQFNEIGSLHTHLQHVGRARGGVQYRPRHAEDSSTSPCRSAIMGGAGAHRRDAAALPAQQIGR